MSTITALAIGLCAWRLVLNAKLFIKGEWPTKPDLSLVPMSEKSLVRTSVLIIAAINLIIVAAIFQGIK